MHHPDTKDTIEALFDEYGNAIYRYARSCLPPDIDPEDVVQEVFLRAFRAWPTFHRESSSKTWLFTIARNYIYDLLRRKRSERAYMLSHQQQFVDDTTTLDSMVEMEELWHRLSLRDQQVLHLRLLQELSVAQTAQVLGWSEIKVRVTFHRAKKRLQQLLAAADDALCPDLIHQQRGFRS